MVKKVIFPLFMSLVIIALAGCAATATPAGITSTPTSAPPTEAASPTAIPIPPTEQPTAVTPTSTVPARPAGAIQLYPNGQEFTVTNIHMIDENIGWAIGSLGALVGNHVLKTTDGGFFWKDVTPPEPEATDGQNSAIGFFQDPQTAWVTYFSGAGTSVPAQPVVWRTTDGGATWTSSQPLDVSGLQETYYPTNMQFVAGQSGWLLVHVGAGMSHDYIAIYRTTDGGATWLRIIDPYIDGGIQGCTKNGMQFTDATHGWLTGDCGGVMSGVLLFKTADSGSTWQAVTLPEPPGATGIYASGSNYACGSHDPFFFSNDLGHLDVLCTNYGANPVTYSFYLYTTQDGGNTWTAASYPGEATYFVSADIGWAIAKKIQVTTDGGATWKPISDVTWSAQLDFVNGMVGWAVARSDTEMALVKSVNGGATWSQLTPTAGQ